MTERLGALKLYRAHLVHQYADRCAVWSLKDLSCDLLSQTVLMSTDGADQAKYAVPRDPGLQSAYRSAKLHRPRLKLHGVWSFGHNLQISVLDEVTFHGSSMVLECISRALEDIMATCREKNQAAPTTLLIVGDNTVKELKNSFCLAALGNLCLHKKLRFPALLKTTFSLDLLFQLACHA